MKKYIMILSLSSFGMISAASSDRLKLMVTAEKGSDLLRSY